MGSGFVKVAARRKIKVKHTQKNNKSWNKSITKESDCFSVQKSSFAADDWCAKKPLAFRFQNRIVSHHIFSEGQKKENLLLSLVSCHTEYLIVIFFALFLNSSFRTVSWGVTDRVSEVGYLRFVAVKDLHVSYIKQNVDSFGGHHTPFRCHFIKVQSCVVEQTKGSDQKVASW